MLHEPDPLEALTEFLYIAPVGLMQFSNDGAVQRINPLAAQLLMPLTPNGNLSDAFSALSPLVPDLSRHLREFTAASGVVLDHQRCEITVGTRSSVLSVTVHRIHGGSNLLVLDDVTRLVDQERQLFADRQRFRAIFDNVRDYAIYTMNPDGLIDEWNQVSPPLRRLGGAGRRRSTLPYLPARGGARRGAHGGAARGGTFSRVRGNRRLAPAPRWHAALGQHCDHGSAGRGRRGARLRGCVA